jgi:hypothetical protein
MKNYVPVTLDQYVNESKSITLKRGYKDKSPVVVGASAPIRNQVLAFVSESKKVRGSELKRFVAGLNETNANPSAAATMWLRRNEKFFITENRQGVTYFKLSPLGRRLVNGFAPNNVNENRGSVSRSMMRDDYEGVHTVIQNLPEILADPDGFYAEIAELQQQYPDFNEQLGEVKGRDKYKDIFLDLVDKYSKEGITIDESKKSKKSDKYDFKDPKTNKPGIVDDEDLDEECGDESKHKKSVKESKHKKAIEESGVSPSRRKRIEEIIENIKTRNATAMNEAEEEKEEEKEGDEGAADELSFDDLDLDAEGDDSGEDKGEEKEGDDLDVDLDGEESEEKTDGDSEIEKVEITEFILTVDDVDAALEELKEKGVNAEKVVDPDAEPAEGEEEAYKEDEISVPADDWDSLRGWLEEKGVDVEEMFGGEIEVEDAPEEGEEGESDLDLDMDLGGEGEGDELELDLGGEGEGDELELDLGGEGEDGEIEESLTGMENHEDDTNNLIKGAKQVVITYK